MARRSCLAALGLAAFALVPPGARANPPSVRMTSPVYTSPLPTAPYWANPYWATPYWASQAASGVAGYFPGSPGLPQQPTNPAAHPNPMSGETCFAPPYTCPAPAADTPGAACSCATNEGRTVTGTVR